MRSRTDIPIRGGESNLINKLPVKWGDKRISVYLLLGLIMLIGLILRFLYLRENISQPEFSHPAIDGAYHDYWARGLAGLGWMVPDGYPDPLIHSSPFFRPPGYPYLLGAFYLISEGSCLTPRMFQMALGLLALLAAFFFTSRWYGTRPALIFAGLMAIYGPYIYFEGELLGVSSAVLITIILLTVTAAWTEKFSFFRGLGSGIVLGGFALFRPNILLFAPVLILWAFRLRHQIIPEGKISLLISGFLLGSLLIVTPVTLRNYIVSGDPVIISAQGGMSLLVGNNEAADGTNHYLPGFGLISSPFDYPAAVRGLEVELGMEKGVLSYSAASRVYALRAIEYIYHHPGPSLRLLVRKTALFWGPSEVANNRDISTVLSHSRLLRLLPFGFSFSLASALIGIFFSFSGAASTSRSIRSRQVSLLVVLFIGTYFISVLPFAAAARYRLPIIPGLLLFSALAFSRLIDILADRKYKWFIFWLVIWGGLLFLTGLDPAGYEASPAKWHYDRGLAYEAGGYPGKAESEYLRALELNTDDFRSRLNLGALLLQRKETAGAIREYQKVIRSSPDFAAAYSNLGEAYFQGDEYRKARASLQKAIKIDPDCFQAYNNLGTLLRVTGDVNGSIDAFRHAIRINPDYGEAHYNLGVVLAGEGRIDEAVEYYRIALWLNPRSADIRNNLGSALASRGETPEAYVLFTEALRLDPGLADGHNNLANILAGRKNYPEAIEHYQQALKINPDYGEACYNLAYTLDLMGERERARRNYERSLRINPFNPRAHYNLAIISLKENRQDEALKHLKKTIALDPKFAPARRLMEKVGSGQWVVGSRGGSSGEEQPSNWSDRSDRSDSCDPSD